MKTAKQINDEKTGQINPIVITKMGKDEKVQKVVKQYTHPLTCKKCHRVINTQLCAVCENEPQWIEKPNEVGWWWFAGNISTRFGLMTQKLEPVNVISKSDNDLIWYEGYCYSFKDFTGKWLKITEPSLPQK